MKVLVATARSQGARADDFDWCVEGELVWVQEPCGRDRRGETGRCGCGRAFAGMASHRATTTAIVHEIERFTRIDYVDALRSSLDDQGWPAGWADELVDELIQFCRHWDVGTVIERHLDAFGPRFDARSGLLLPRLDARAA